MSRIARVAVALGLTLTGVVAVIVIAASAGGNSPMSHADEPRSLRILSLDQCADQYAMALAGDAELALSPRADDPDSWMKAQARDHRRVRPTLEAAIAFQPDVVVRYWGGDRRLLARLEAEGIRIIQIEDSSDIGDVKKTISDIAERLDRKQAGRDLVAQMDDRLSLSAVHVRSGNSRISAQYVTAGGYTTGPGTLVDAMMGAAGLTNVVTRPGYGPYSLERIVMAPPAQFVRGFFDQVRADWKGVGRHPVLRTLNREPPIDLPASVLTCPAWFVADGVAMMSRQSK